MAQVYSMVEKLMPWTYTGIYSSPEFKSHIPIVGEFRQSPANPTFSALPACPRTVHRSGVRSL